MFETERNSASLPDEGKTSRHLSVLLTCYNERAFVDSAVASILLQPSHLIADILIVNDGSTDSSADLLKEIAQGEPRIAVYNIDNRGVAGARNFGMLQTKTPFVALLDGDDFWHREKLEHQWNRVKNSPANVALWYTDYVDFTSVPEAGIPVPVRRYDASDARTLEDFFVYDGPIVPSTVILRTEAFHAVGGFDEDVRLFEDMDLWLRLAAAGWRFQHVPGPLTFKRRRVEGLSQQLENIAGAVERVGEGWASSVPSLQPLVSKRRSWRAARLAQAYFAARQDREGWRLLKKAFADNPFNLRLYAYAAAALPPLKLRTAFSRAVKRLRGARARISA